uniref:SPARC/Testican calcium-binding domain-containing protein n=2 Tax=Meloidogyne incognita group TaxID=654580 RepID=A0A914N5R0_MELIC
MLQFPERMADWLFQVMKELKKRRELQGLEWEELINEAEQNDDKRHVYPVIWKFCDLDIKPHDKHVSHHELIPITAPVIPMESCIKPFLEGCDTNKDGSITIKEWGICLGLKEGEIQERC